MNFEIDAVECASWATAFPNVLNIMGHINFQSRTSKLEWQGTQAAAEIRQKHALTQSFHVGQGQAACRVTQGDGWWGPHTSIPHCLTTPMEIQSSTWPRGGGEGGIWETSVVAAASLAHRRSPVIRTQLKKKNRTRRLSSALIPCQVWWR